MRSTSAHRGVALATGSLRRVRRPGFRTRLTLTAVIAAVASLLPIGAHPLAAQTLGPVTLAAGLGVAYQARKEFNAVGAHLWLGAETVLDKKVRVRLDVALHRFGYASPSIAACAATTYCAPVLTTPLQLGAITATIVWRDTSGVRRWYYLAGLGAYSALGGRDANSRLGVTAGLGRELGATRSFLVEARVHVPYDGNGYGFFIPVTAGWNFGHFLP